MGMRLHPAGRREMLLMTLLLGGPAAVFYLIGALGHGWAWPVAAILTLCWLGGLAFFRDPDRSCPGQPHELLAPADGKVVEISRLDHHPDIGGPATRIGIFLSVFNVHVNRSPSAGSVREVHYQPGEFLDARDPQSSARNEAATIVIDSVLHGQPSYVVRQISGKVARRIVCDLNVGQRVERGQRIGLIKFGSRTELILPGHDRFAPAVDIGDKVKGAATIIARQLRTASDAPTSTAPDQIEVSS